jgi:hypothetical protein
MCVSDPAVCRLYGSHATIVLLSVLETVESED